MSLSTNAVVGDYRILDCLGAGGMGEVYRAVDRRTNKLVALKVILADKSDRSFVARFMNEARILATVRHRNIVGFVEFLQHEGNPCLVMEYVEGKMLAELIDSRGRFPSDEALGVVEALGEAVAHLHGLGIIHRDLKPANVLIASDGQVKLLDFGIAKGGITPKLTATGGAIGTFQYLPPERINGAEADARTDVWALGVILYEMVTGSSPFQAGSFGELCQKIGKAAYTRPSAIDVSVPNEVEQIITRCLRKQPRDRYQTAGEFLADVKRLRATPSHLVGPASEAKRPGTDRLSVLVDRLGHRPGRARRIVLATSAAILALVVIAAVIFGLLAPRSGPGSADAARGAKRKIRIETYTTAAQVYRDDALIGTTPIEIEARDGEEINVVLKQSGYSDLRPPSIKVMKDDTVKFRLERGE